MWQLRAELFCGLCCAGFLQVTRSSLWTLSSRARRPGPLDRWQTPEKGEGFELQPGKKRTLHRFIFRGWVDLCCQSPAFPPPFCAACIRSTASEPGQRSQHRHAGPTNSQNSLRLKRVGVIRASKVAFDEKLSKASKHLQNAHVLPRRKALTSCSPNG